MRYHRGYPLLQLCRDRERLRRVVGASALVSARIEPAMRQIAGTYVADLVFERDGEVAVVSGMLLDAPMLAEPECSPFVWPQAVHDALDDETTGAVERIVLPWIESRTLGRQFNEEQLCFFTGGAARSRVERARELGLFGAAHYARALAGMTPYVLAARSARGRRVAVRDTMRGAAGAVLLARIARAVDADLGSATDNRFAAEWFGCDVFHEIDTEQSYDLAIAPRDAMPSSPRRVTLDGDETDGAVLPIVQPLPLDVLTSCETEDGDAIGRFAVRMPEVALRQPLESHVPAVVGGSSGRVLFVLRDDFARNDDADDDEANALAERLRAEGFTVDVRSSSGVSLDGYDLVHAFTLPAVQEWDELTERAHAAGIPVIVSANLDDVAAQGVWGTGMSGLLATMAVDAAGDDERCDLFVQRKLETATLGLPRQEPYPRFEPRVRQALQACDGVIVHSVAEERLLRERFGFTGASAQIGPCFTMPRRVEGCEALVGDREFVFAHAPIGRRANFVALARAAMRADLPLVIAGPVTDANYLALVRQAGDERVTILTTVTPGQVAWLYRRARVYADVGWISCGPARQARAALCGCVLVLTRESYAVAQWAPGLWPVDAADERAIALGLADAWMKAGEPAVAACASRIAAACDVGAALSRVAQLYARAQRVPVG